MNNFNKSSFLVQNEGIENLAQPLEFIPTGVFIIDDSLVINNANEAAINLIGSDKESIVGRKILEFVAKQDASLFNKLLLQSFVASDPGITEIRIRKTDHSYINTLVMIKCSKDSNSDKKFCSVVFIDFTTQKMNEEIIKQSESRFKSLTNTAPVMIWISDVEGLFSFVNKIWLEYTGTKLGDQLGMSWLRYVHPEDHKNLLEIYQKAISTKLPFTAEFRFKTNTNQYEWMNLSGKPRFNDENIFMGFIGSCFSINEQKDIEAKVSKMNIELVEINATKDKFFSIISHDLRSPLGGLMQMLEILVEDYSVLDEKEKQEILSEAARTAKNTYMLMENLLEWSRFQTGKVQFSPKKINLLKLVNAILELYHQNIKFKELTLNVNIDPVINIYADTKITETVLRNLISNAIKFTFPKGSVTLTSEVDNDFVIVKVMDTGVGISDENVQKLFRLDVNHTSLGTNNESGTGIGLILCKEFVEKQGGKIWLESKLNLGSSFYFTVPFSK